MRDWWLRTLIVLQRPRRLFVALRANDAESLGNRSEPVLAVIILAGIAGVLSTSTAAHLLDDNSFDNVDIAIWAFLFGGIYGAASYWFLGALLHAGSKALGSQGTYRRSRHVLAFAAVPVALSLILWPVKIAVYGDDAFRSGGGDTGTGGHVFTALSLVFVAWAAALLVTGVRSVHGWTWGRAAAACALAVLGPVVVGLAISSL
jgi:hypothetical protein